MNETIMLPVDYQGETIELPLNIVTLGYTYQLHIQVQGRTLIFEKDDEGQYRVIDLSGSGPDHVDKHLITAILETLQGL
ncbi:hypothetical protein [Dyadobacter sandarakinus]|uniref:Uncharacterized protein n=1 Tax=Dyadobacter sandarakinus TaxID=2747268 RepID=A0ABX7I2W1_9BACT|nr:hypothetical protein [Dyadobacter sandarakinus]QRR00058.1 hypothetical protein HWI92_03580 [Dyadobacter sandarakinus]